MKDPSGNKSFLLEDISEIIKEIIQKLVLAIAKNDGASENAIEIIKRELEYLGTPYPPYNEKDQKHTRISGHLDCSQLAMIGYGDAFSKLKHDTTRYQSKRAMIEDAGWDPHNGDDLSDIKPGDAIFFCTDPNDISTVFHIATYIGGGLMIDSVLNETVDGVSIRPVDVIITHGDDLGCIYGYATPPSP